MSSQSTSYYPCSSSTEAAIVNSATAVIPYIASSTRAIAILDSRLSDLPTLKAALHDDIPVYVLHPEADGIEQIDWILRRLGSVQVLYLFGHGAPGVMQLGQGELSQASLTAAAARIAHWRVNVIHLYGCEIGQDQALLKSLHHLTGASVAASTQWLGTQGMESYWTLETAIGSLTAPAPFQPDMLQTYAGTLPITFGTSFLAAGSTSYDIAQGDWDKDGKLDLVVANYDDKTVTYYFGAGDGTFQAARALSFDSSPSSVVSGDWNKDGFTDFAVGLLDGTVITYSGRSDRNLVASTPLNLGITGIRLATGDWNNNGTLDLMATQYGGGMGTQVRFLSNTNGVFSVSTTLSGNYAGPGYAAVADFDNNGWVDIAVPNSFAVVGTSIILNDPITGLAFSSSVGSGGEDAGWEALAIDFDNDNDKDLAIVSSDGYVSLYKNNGTGVFSSHDRLSLGGSARGIVAADLDGDQDLDLAVGIAGEVKVFLNQGGTFVSDAVITVDGNATQLTAGDFNQDGMMDLAVTTGGGSTGNQVAILLNTFVPTPFVNLSVSTNTGTEEGTTAITITVSSSKPVEGDQLVTLAIAGLNITTDDYTLSSPTVTIANGDTKGTVTFTVKDDQLREGAETATVSIDKITSGLKLGTVTSQDISILDNDVPAVNLAVSTTTASEDGKTVITVTATVSDPVTSAETVKLAVTGMGIAAGDYTLSSQTITIPQGALSGFVTFTVQDDQVIEGTETATIAISEISGGLKLGTTTSHAIAIADNDFPVANLTVNTTAASEAGQTVVTITATTDAPVIGNQTVNIGVSGDNITSNDYTLSNSVLTIAAGQTSGFVTFTVKDDRVTEVTESALITMSNPSSGLVLGATTTQTIAIEDNDIPGITITHTDGGTAVTEGAGFDMFYVTLNTAPANTVTLTLTPDSQITVSDPTTLTFTPTNWSTPQLVVITAVDDKLSEGSHTGQLTFTSSSADSHYNSLVIPPLSITITDNDNPPTDITLSNNKVNENLAGNNLIGSFTTTDPDGGSFSYTLVSGTGDTHNSAFSLSGNSLYIKDPANFEAQSSYTIRVKTTDSSTLSFEKTFTINVNDGNDAPVLTDTVVNLRTQTPNSGAPSKGAGTLVSQLVGFSSGTGQKNVTDPDSGANLGIALVGIDTTQGTWHYSTDDGGSWTAISSVSDSNALLLAADTSTRLYFQPNVGYKGTIENAITFRAWDQTVGVNGNTITIPTFSNTSAFSAATDTATLRIQPSTGADFNGDGKTDVLWRNIYTGDNATWLMDGTTVKDGRLFDAFNPAFGWDMVGSGDFTGDGKTDLLWRNRNTGENGVWEMDGTITRKGIMLDSMPVSSGWDIVATADMTGDGKVDILWHNRYSGDIGYWEMNGTTTASGGLLKEAGAVPSSSGWYIVGAGDFTQDGKADILWHNYYTGDVGYWEMNGTTFVRGGSITQMPLSSGWYVVGCSDFNQDSKADLFWQNVITGDTAIWTMDGSTPKGGFVTLNMGANSGWAAIL